MNGFFSHGCFHPAPVPAPAKKPAEPVTRAKIDKPVKVAPRR